MRFDIRPATIAGVTGLTITAGVKSYQLRWTHTTSSVAVWASKLNDRNTATLVATVTGDTYTHVTDGAQHYFWTQTLDAKGRAVGAWNPTARTGGLTAAPSTIGRINLAASSKQWSIDPAGLPVNTDIVLTANLLGGLEGYVTWSRSGPGTAVPTAGTTNVWRVYAADQTVDAVTYTAALTYGGVTTSGEITLYKVKDGATGDSGQLGSLTGYGKAYEIVSSVWSDSIANRVISNMLLGETLKTPLATTYHLMPGDTVTLSNQESFAETRFWDSSRWLLAGTVIDGNLLVKGTVAADALTAGSIKTGYNANARINIGETTFVGSITSPFHVAKETAQNNQALITAQNTKDDSVAIWGSSTYANGNSVSGTWHASLADAAAGKWKCLGVLGSDMADAGVYGAVYAEPTKAAGVFNYFTTESNASAPVISTSVRLAAIKDGAPFAISATGAVQLFGASSPMILNDTAGVAGQALVSQGVGATPIWADISGAGSGVLYSSIQSCLGGTTGSPLNLTTTFRSTGVNAPTSGSGVELAYHAGAGWVIAGTRNASAAIASYSPLYLHGSEIGLNVTPTFPTTATSDNSTKAATTAFVKAQSYATQSYVTSQGYITSTGSCSYAASAGSASTATSAGDATTVGGKKVKGGSGAGGTAVSTGLTTIEGFSAIAVDGYVTGVSSISGGSVTVITRNFSGVASAQAFRWVATGT